MQNILFNYDRLFQLQKVGVSNYQIVYKTQYGNILTNQFLLPKSKMEKFALINKITQKTLSRDHTFFSNPNRHRPWSDDKKTLDLAKISDLNLECIGYGEFYPTQIVERFARYFTQCLRDIPNLKQLKLKINGFDLKQCPNLISSICKAIEQIPTNTLKLLQIQTTKLVNCDAVEHFGNLFRTSLRLGRIQRQGSLKAVNPFESLTLQFADWQFIYQNQKSQPNSQTLKNQLAIVEDQAFDADGYCFKKFRLQLSTWYYTQKETDIFFHSIKEGQKFHQSMKQFVQTCYKNMPDLQYFEFDLRNWHSDFQLPKLRDILMMIPKEGARNMSINSKNISRYRRKHSQINPTENDEEDIILFERHFVI